MRFIRGKNRLAAESGQSTLEFALTLVLLMAFFLFFVQLALVFSVGNYVHYATFMSARAYLSSGADQNDQEDRAQSVIVTMLKKSQSEPATDKFPTIAKGVDGDKLPGFEVRSPTQYVANNRQLSWLQGVRYNFRSKLFLVPLAGGSASASASSSSANSLTLRSESWLGRETTEEECMTSIGKQNGIVDNGC